MVAPVRCWWRSSPAVSVLSFKAAPPAAGVGFVVPRHPQRLRCCGRPGMADGMAPLAGRRGLAPPAPWWPMVWFWPVGAFG